MSKYNPNFTATHYAAAAFTAAFFSIIAVLAVIGGTASGNAKETDATPPDTSAEVDTNTDHDTVRPNRDRPPHRRPGGRRGRPSFDDIDADSDGNITRTEFDEFHANRRPPGQRGPGRHARGGSERPDHPHDGEFDGPPPRGRGGFDGPPRGPRGGERDFRGGPGGERGHRGPPPPHMRGQGPDGNREGPPPRRFEGEGPRGPGAGGPGGFDRRPPRPEFNQLDTNGDGSISRQEFDDFRPPRGPRGPRGDRRGFPEEESFD